MEPWDGSHLGKIEDRDIVSKTSGPRPFSTLTFRFQEQTYQCWVKRISTLQATLIDELKPLFGLAKLGTHSIFVKSRLYLLVRPFTGPHCQLDEIRFSPSRSFREQVQLIFAFRHVLALSCSFESSIQVRSVYGLSYPISFRDGTMNFWSTRPILPGTILKKWFKYDHESIRETLLRALDIDVTRLTAFMLRFRTSLEVTILRLDKSLIWTSNYILERLMNHLYNTPNLLLQQLDSESGDNEKERENTEQS